MVPRHNECVSNRWSIARCLLPIAVSRRRARTISVWPIGHSNKKQFLNNTLAVGSNEIPSPSLIISRRPATEIGAPCLA